VRESVLRQARLPIFCGIIVISLIGLRANSPQAQVTTPGSSPPPLLIVPAPGPAAAPPLASSNIPAAESVPPFIDWASRSGTDQREEVRKLIAAAGKNSDVAEELCREIFEIQNSDHSRTLIMLSVLGEMRNPDGEKCLIRFIHQTFPTQGTVVNGEILEQTSLGTLQSKAVDGLAYAATETGDHEVLWAAGAHPARIVRAEAINAYLWNHRDSRSARAALLKVVRPDEAGFLDRPRHEPGMTRDQFNSKLLAYAKKHPAPKPERRVVRKLTPAQGVGDLPPPDIGQRPTSPPPQEATGRR
jgi:hypothetical protein